jgi:hypothetical protein
VLPRDHPNTLTSLNGLAFSVLRQNRTAEAMRIAARSLAICRDKLGDQHTTTAAAGLVVGLCESRAGRHGDAEVTLRRVLNAKEADPLLMSQAQARLGLALGSGGHRAEADSLLDDSLRELPDWHAETHEIIRDVLLLYRSWEATDSTGTVAKKAAALRLRTRQV